MKIVYTGAPKFLDVQTDPGRSLGGYISVSDIPNDVLGNLFSEISPLSIENGEVVRVIAFKNDSGSTITGFTVYVNAPVEDTGAASFEIGYEVPTLDSNGDLVIEELPNQYASPLNVTLNDATGPGSAITLPDIQDGDYLGLFIKRVIIKENVQLTDQQIIDNYIEGTELEKEETISLVFSWS